ncbi:MAG: hypothetical protein JWO31_4043, partial [Phycisphaerales bacterium]|nr:hypothetical protein [Phycisphaerales bacterium]
AAGYAAVPPLVRQRVVRVAAALMVAGLTLYGLLTLLRDLMGFLLTAALVIVCAAVGLAAVRVGSVYARRWVAAARSRRSPLPTRTGTPPSP